MHLLKAIGVFSLVIGLTGCGICYSSASSKSGYLGAIAGSQIGNQTTVNPQRLGFAYDQPGYFQKPGYYRPDYYQKPGYYSQQGYYGN
jgi:hypothetical protein